MKTASIICLLIALAFGCSSQNTQQTNSRQEENAINHEPTLNWDSTFMENDSTIYDSQLQTSPFTNSTIEWLENNADSINNHKIQAGERTYNLKKMCYHDSYMLFAESDEYGKSLLSAVISDTLISLSNHIKVGDERKKLEAYYHRKIKCDKIRFIDESEFTEVIIYLKKDAICKIIFVCYECENELGLL